jgi:hypothetical protein
MPIIPTVCLLLIWYICISNEWNSVSWCCLCQIANDIFGRNSDMTPESRNNKVRIDVHCYAATRETHSRGNDCASNNWVTTVAMQQRCKHAFPTREAVFSVWSVQSSFKEEFSWEESSRVSRRQPARLWAWGQRNWTESSLRNWQVQNIDKKGVRLCQEDFMCKLKLQWDCYKSVARLRLVKTENLSAWATVNWKCVE